MGGPHDYPADDQEFETKRIAKVELTSDKKNWTILNDDGWSITVERYSVVPEVGNEIRIYGTGFGYRFRGVFIDGWKVFYRTREEDEVYYNLSLYGADVADWLKRWDEGRSVWSFEMGGIGPSYEQCIQIAATEVVRHLLSVPYDASAWNDQEQWKHDLVHIEKYLGENVIVRRLGLSGAQWGAAINLGSTLYRHGPVACFTKPENKNRLIQVQKHFPSLP